jgi:ligand-binding SRPBCC domain-containing protein
MPNLEFHQFLPISIEEAWDFFSTPENLNKITLPEMNFVIITKLPRKVYPGLIIVYKVSPVAGIPMNWVTEITHVKEPDFFVDEQRTGPYSIWHHEHHFEVVDGGVMMTDKLYYKVPMGFIGVLLDRIFIREKVEGIFTHREKVLLQLFPG